MVYSEQVAPNAQAAPVYVVAQPQRPPMQQMPMMVQQPYANASMATQGATLMSPPPQVAQPVTVQWAQGPAPVYLAPSPPSTSATTSPTSSMQVHTMLVQQTQP